MLSNGSEHLRNVIQWHQNSFFFQNITKNRPTDFSTISLSPLPLQNPGYVQTGNNDFRSFIDIFVPQKLPLWKNFDDVLPCDLWFRPSLIKNLGYANELEIA